MTMRLSILIDANGQVAKAEVQELGAAVRKTGNETREMGQKSSQAARETRALGGAVRGTEPSVEALSAAQRRNAATAEIMGRSNNVAAGQMGNLVAQFNDIGMMMAAGQNPLQLAIQQGTQITQVIGPMGAAGAARALGSAFVQMLNPINFVTIGAIAAAAALTQWLVGSRDDAVEMGDQLNAMADALDRFDTTADTAMLSARELFEEFGTASPVMQQVLRDLAGLEKIAAYREIDKTTEALRDLITARQFADWMITDKSEFFGRGLERALRDAGEEFAVLMTDLTNSEDPARRLAAALDLRATMLAATGGLEGMNLEQQEFYRGLTLIIRDMELLGVKAEEFEMFDPEEQARLDAFVARMEDAIAVGERQEEIAARKAARDQDAAEAMLADLARQIDLQATINSYGEDSAEVARLRAAHERDVFAEMVNSLDISEDLKQELIRSANAAQMLAQTDMSGGIEVAATAAEQLAVALGVSLARAQAILTLSQSVAVPSSAPGAGAGPSDPGLVNQTGTTNPLAYTDTFSLPEIPRVGRAASGGGSAASAERDAVEELVESLRDELDLVRTLDPVLREMHSHRETLAEATEAERAQVEQLIAERMREEATLERQIEQWDTLNETSFDILEGLRTRTMSWNDALVSVIGTIGDLVAKAALLGQGPLAQFFGGSQDGGLLGQLFSFLVPSIAPAGLPKRAEGGIIYGPGGPRDDRVPILASPGEFMMNAMATQRHRPLLEMLNAGLPLPGFAAGGAIGAAAMPGRTGAADEGLIRVELDPGLVGEIVQQSERRTLALMERSDRRLEGRVNEIVRKGDYRRSY